MDHFLPAIVMISRLVVGPRAADDQCTHQVGVFQRGVDGYARARRQPYEHRRADVEMAQERRRCRCRGTRVGRPPARTSTRQKVIDLLRQVGGDLTDADVEACVRVLTEMLRLFDNVDVN